MPIITKNYNKIGITLKELKMEVLNLSRSDRISSVARNELNMVPAEPETLMIFINKDQVGLLN